MPWRGFSRDSGRYIGPTGLWNLLEEIHRVVWNIPMQLRPSILMGDPAC